MMKQTCFVRCRPHQEAICHTSRGRQVFLSKGSPPITVGAVLEQIMKMSSSSSSSSSSTSSLSSSSLTTQTKKEQSKMSQTTMTRPSWRFFEPPPKTQKEEDLLTKSLPFPTRRRRTRTTTTKPANQQQRPRQETKALAISTMTGTTTTTTKSNPLPLDLFVSCLPGLEPLLSQELEEKLNLRNTITNGGVWIYQACVQDIYHIHLWIGISQQVHIRCCKAFKCRTLAILRRKITRIPWKKWLHEETSHVIIHVKSSKSKLVHSIAIAEKVKLGIDEALGRINPNKFFTIQDKLAQGRSCYDDKDEDGNTIVVDRDKDDDDDHLDNRNDKKNNDKKKNITDLVPRDAVPILVKIFNDYAHISIETSSTPMYQRGYRILSQPPPPSTSTTTTTTSMILNSGDDSSSNQSNNDDAAHVDDDGNAKEMMTTTTTQDTSDNLVMDTREDVAYAMVYASRIAAAAAADRPHNVTEEEEDDNEDGKAHELVSSNNTTNTTKMRILDPFCGTGSIAIEACQILLNLAPGRLREAPLVGTKLYSPMVWKELQQQHATTTTTTTIKPFSILASDRDVKKIGIAQENAQRAGVASWIHFWTAPSIQEAFAKLASRNTSSTDGGSDDCDDGTDSPSSLHVLTSPPYGSKRIFVDSTNNNKKKKRKKHQKRQKQQRKSHQHLWPLYRTLGEQSVDATSVHVLSTNMELVKRIGLHDVDHLFRTDQQGSRITAMRCEIAVPPNNNNNNNNKH